MDCAKARELLMEEAVSAVGDGADAPGGAGGDAGGDAVLAHLGGCVPCREWHARLTDLEAGLSALPVMEPSSGTMRKVAASKARPEPATAPGEFSGELPLLKMPRPGGKPTGKLAESDPFADPCSDGTDSDAADSTRTFALWFAGVAACAAVFAGTFLLALRGEDAGRRPAPATAGSFPVPQGAPSGTNGTASAGTAAVGSTPSAAQAFPPALRPNEGAPRTISVGPAYIDTDAVSAEAAAPDPAAALSIPPVPTVPPADLPPAGFVFYPQPSRGDGAVPPEWRSVRVVNPQVRRE
jgi:hypothetical protein